MRNRNFKPKSRKLVNRYSKSSNGLKKANRKRNYQSKGLLGIGFMGL